MHLSCSPPASPAPGGDLSRRGGHAVRAGGLLGAAPAGLRPYGDVRGSTGEAREDQDITRGVPGFLQQGTGAKVQSLAAVAPRRGRAPSVRSDLGRQPKRPELPVPCLQLRHLRAERDGGAAAAVPAAGGRGCEAGADGASGVRCSSVDCSIIRFSGGRIGTFSERGAAGRIQALCPPMSHETHAATAAALDGKIYVMGGFFTRRAVQVFDTASGSWGGAPALTCERWFAAAAVVGNRIYMTGGWEGKGSQSRSSMETWIPGSSEGWRPGKNPKARRSAHAAVELAGKLVLLGGRDGQHQWLKHVQSFDPSSQTWQDLPPLREPRAALAAATLGGKIFVVGGYDGSSVLCSVEIFDPAEGSWSSGPRLGRARNSHVAEAVSGRLYVLGGDTSEAIRSTEVFDPSRGCWAEGPTLKHPRDMSAAAAWDKTLYVLGGYSFHPDVSETAKSVEVLPS